MLYSRYSDYDKEVYTYCNSDTSCMGFNYYNDKVIKIKRFTISDDTLHFRLNSKDNTLFIKPNYLKNQYNY